MRDLTAPVLMILVFVAGCSASEPEPAERWIVTELGTDAAFRDVFFLDESRGWIVGGGFHVDGGLLGKTEDGGSTWRFSSGLARPSSRPRSFHVNAVWFLDERRGFAAGDGYQLLRTVDGGEHWHRLPPRRGVWAHLRDLHFVGQRRGWAVGPGGMLRTNDGGASWTAVYSPGREGEPDRPVTGHAVHFVDAGQGCLVGRHGGIRITRDGGDTWARVREPRSGAPHLWGLDFADEGHGWAVGGQGTILHTSDGGESWQRQAGGASLTLMDVDFTDARRGWAVGFDRNSGSSAVLETRDGGTEWRERARVESEALHALFVLDERHAWALGEQQRRTDHDGTQKILRLEVRDESARPDPS